MGDRRRSIRFPLNQQLSYQILDARGIGEQGCGMSIDISSRGVLFDAGKDLPLRKRILLSVEWPAVLDGRCALKLIIPGRITRSSRGQIAVVRTAGYEFRTRRLEQRQTALQSARAV